MCHNRVIRAGMFNYVNYDELFEYLNYLVLVWFRVVNFAQQLRF